MNFSRRFSAPVGLTVAVAIWAAITVGFPFAMAWWTTLLALLMMAALPIWGLISLALLILCAVSGIRGPRRGGLLLAVAMIVVLAVVNLANVVGPAGDDLRFRLERPAYDKVVAEVASGQWRTEDVRRLRGVVIRTDPGPPSRVAFVWSGMGDNWAGVVWDPTDIVATATGWDGAAGRYTASPIAKKLFGGDLVWCSQLSGHYYRCGFT